MTPAQIIAAIFGSGWTWGNNPFTIADPTNPNSSGHSGIDIVAKIGTPIPALVGGTVIYAENAGGGGGLYATPYSAPTDPYASSALWTTGGGNTVVVQAADGTRYIYAHLSGFAVKTGDTVSAGQLLGQVGQTGDATGPHLHFGVVQTAATHIVQFSTTTNYGRVNKTLVDPLTVLGTLATSGASFNLLGAWNNAVAFPVGTPLTEDRINTIIAALDAQHFFQSSSNIPGLQQLSENTARDTTRAILEAHKNEPWSSTLEQSLQTQLFGAATAAVTNPVQSLADIAGKLVDPMTYVHTGAFLIGAVLLFVGFKWIAQGNGNGAATSSQ